MEIIQGACYFIREHSHSEFYDYNGNLIRSIDFSPRDFIDCVDLKLKEYLDPECQGKARPSYIKIRNHDKLGRSIYFYDKSGNIIDCQDYSGSMNLEELVKYQLGREYRCPMDYGWILENDIPVVNGYQSNFDLSCVIL